MFDNPTTNKKSAPENLPTDADSSSVQSNVGKTENTVNPKDSNQAAASPIRHDGQIEDIFAGTDQAGNQSHTNDFKVSSAAQGSGKNSLGGYSSPISPTLTRGRSNRGESLYSPGEAVSSVPSHEKNQGQLASPAYQGGSAHFLSGLSLKNKTDNGLGSGNLTPDKIEFSDDKSPRKKYFIIGLIGLLVVGFSALAYWLLILNKPLELDSSLNINSPDNQPVNTQTGNPQVPFQVTPPKLESTTPPVVLPVPPPPPAEQVKPDTQSPQPALSDLDQDGLLDSEEVALKTNPRKADTDSDGLFDREEVKVYLTDPNDPDTDDDGYLDGEEVANGFNPKGEGKLLPEIN